MSQEISNAFGGNMPTTFDPQALAQSTASLPKAINKPFLSFRDGEWTFGADHAEIEEGSHWAVNPASFQFGLIEWCDNKAGAELMVPAGQKYSANDLNLQFDPNDEDHRIAPQVAIDLKCVSGDDEDMEVHYKTSTRGGTDALNDLANKIGAQAGKNPNEVVAVVGLAESSYRHKKYGKKYTPVFDLQYFDDFELSNTSGSDKPLIEEELINVEKEKAEEAPKSRSRRTRK